MKHPYDRAQEIRERLGLDKVIIVMDGYTGDLWEVDAREPYLYHDFEKDEL